VTADATLVDGGYPRQLGLRVHPSRDAARRVEELLGSRLPTEPNTVGNGVLWLGPDEWLIVDRDLTETQLQEVLAGEGAAVELSANRLAIHLSGPGARDVLASCCPLDLHPRVFGAGDCTQTLVAGVAVIIEQLSDQPSFRLLVRPSFAAHVRAWLIDAIEGPE
jgi:sarcosine oxidase, subunit gamma